MIVEVDTIFSSKEEHNIYFYDKNRNISRQCKFTITNNCLFYWHDGIHTIITGARLRNGTITFTPMPSLKEDSYKNVYSAMDKKIHRYFFVTSLYYLNKSLK